MGRALLYDDLITTKTQRVTILQKQANEARQIIEVNTQQIATNKGHVDTVGENVIDANKAAEEGHNTLAEAVEIYKRGGKVNRCILWTVIFIAVIVALLVIFHII